MDSQGDLNIAEPVKPMFGENLRIDADDEEYLEELPEIERELILEERFRIWQKYREDRMLYDKYVHKDAPEPSSKHKTDRSSDRKSAPVVREKQQRKRGKIEYREDSDSSSGSSSDSSSSYSSSSSDDEKAVLKRQAVQSRTEREIAESMESPLDVEMARKLQVSRDSLQSSYHNVPKYLRDATLIDLLIRVPNGSGGYSLGQIVGVKEMGGKFDLLTTVHNSMDSAASSVVPVASVSNSELTEEELQQWHQSAGVDVTKNLARISSRKLSHIKQVMEFVWDDSMINKMLEEKRKLSDSRVNSVKLTLEIAKLRTSLQAELGALSNPSFALSDVQRDVITQNIARIKSEISELENQYRQAQRAFQEANAHQYGIVAINHRNKKEQRKQELDEARQRNQETRVETTDSSLNPFKRRECKPVMMWDVGNKSPRKEKTPIADNTQAVESKLETEKITTPEKRKLSDFIDMNSLADMSVKALVAPDGRLHALQKCMRQAYAKSISPLWPVAHTSGEVMSFDEWKRRVDEESHEE